MAHIPPREGWYSRDSLCYGVGARMEYINVKIQKNTNSYFLLMAGDDGRCGVAVAVVLRVLGGKITKD